jgi:TetR/AcrR family transcriptional regulator, transcriptional repressor of aconitase
MQDIVRQSKLSPGAIYNYFRSKEKIIEAIANHRHAAERELFAEAKREATVEKVFDRIRNSFFGQLEQPAGRLRRRVTIQCWSESQRNPRILKLIRRGLKGPRILLGGILRRAQRRGEIDKQVDTSAVARFLIASYHGLALQAEWGEKIGWENFNKLLDRFLHAIMTNHRSRCS